MDRHALIIFRITVKKNAPMVTAFDLERVGYDIDGHIIHPGSHFADEAIAWEAMRKNADDSFKIVVSHLVKARQDLVQWEADAVESKQHMDAVRKGYEDWKAHEKESD